MTRQAATARWMVGRARRTTWRERGALTQAFVYVAAVDLALRARGFGWLAPRLRAVGGEPDAAALERARTLGRAVERASRLYPSHAECLHRAAALQLWLRRSGVPSEFRIGVRKDGDELRAHAWVEVAGTPVNEPLAAIASFAPIYVAGAGRSVIGMLRRDGGHRWS